MMNYWNRRHPRAVWEGIGVVLLLGCLSASAAADAVTEAAKGLRGFCVHLGAGDGRRTVAIAKAGEAVVHALAGDANAGVNGTGYFFCSLGRPRGRRVVCRPHWRAIFSTHRCRPNGQPRRTQRRKAASSSSVWGRLTWASQSGGRAHHRACQNPGADRRSCRHRKRPVNPTCVGGHRQPGIRGPEGRVPAGRAGPAMHGRDGELQGRVCRPGHRIRARFYDYRRVGTRATAWHQGPWKKYGACRFGRSTRRALC